MQDRNRNDVAQAEVAGVAGAAPGNGVPENIADPEEQMDQNEHYDTLL